MMASASLEAALAMASWADLSGSATVHGLPNLGQFPTLLIGEHFLDHLMVRGGSFLSGFVVGFGQLVYLTSRHIARVNLSSHLPSVVQVGLPLLHEALLKRFELFNLIVGELECHTEFEKPCGHRTMSS